MKKCCFTGHRHFPWEESKDDSKLRTIMASLEHAIDEAIRKGAAHFICGNAVGVDTWAAQLVLKKKELNPGIVLEIALPFEGHNDYIPLCRAIQKKADIVHVVSRRPDKKAAFSERNKYMVDSSDMLIGVYNPSHRRGGTARTIEYARQQGLEVIEIVAE